MSLLSPQDKEDSINPLKQQEDSVAGIHPGFLQSTSLGFKEGLTDSVLGLAHLTQSSNLQPIHQFGLTETVEDQEKDLAELQGTEDTYKQIIGQERGFSAAAGNFLGQALNPIFIGAGAVTGGAADLGLDILPGLAKETLPKIFGEGVAKKVAELAPEAIKGGAFVGGGSLPGAVADNYANNTKSINWGGVATNVGENFGMGMALAPVIPVLGSILRKLKVRGTITQDATKVSGDEVQEAVQQGALSPNEEEFLKAYNADEVTDKLDVMAKQWFNENSPDALNQDGNLHVSIADANQNSLLSDNIFQEMGNENEPSDKTPLSDSIVSAQIGDTVSDQDVQNGVDGLVAHSDKAKTNFDTVLADTLKDVRKSVKELPEDTVTTNQNSIFKLAMQDNYHGILPENVREKVALKKHIIGLRIDLKEKVPKLPIIDNFRNNIRASVKSDIEKFTKQSNEIKLLPSSDELKFIEESLFKDGELPNDYEKSPHYRRLLEMIQNDKKSLNARLLSAKVKLTGDLNRQQGFTDMAKMLGNKEKDPDITSNKGNAAIQYARDNIIKKQSLSNESVLREARDSADIESKKVPDEEIEKSDIFTSTESKKLLNDANNIIRESTEMKKSKGVFDELNACIGNNV